MVQKKPNPETGSGPRESVKLGLGKEHDKQMQQKTSKTKKMRGKPEGGGGKKRSKPPGELKINKNRLQVAKRREGRERRGLWHCKQKKDRLLISNKGGWKLEEKQKDRQACTGP